MSSIPEATAVLLGAADVIDERGHHKGYYVDADGTGVCAVGAMCVAVGLQPFAIAVHTNATDPRLDVVRAATRRLRQHVDAIRVPDWNDAPERTAEQVTTALRECAAAELEASTR